MTPAEMLKMAGGAIGALFFIFYAYQVVYALVPLFAKAPARREPGMRRYAVLIAARNEEAVIARLIESIKDQDYPSELVSIFVVADNCTDSTAECARRAGAEVFERFDKVRAGKGYALSFLLARVHAEYGKEFDGYFVFDADNLLDRRYIGEMDRAFGPDCQIVTSCRNSKNYGDSWVSAGNALRFLYDSELLNRPRMLLGTACTVGGTGFLVGREALMRAGGWRFFLMSEDTEFTVSSVLAGEKIGYCPSAVFYDEQPVSFAQSWRQRRRWVRGYIQVFAKYGARALASLRNGGFACYDVCMSNLPAMLLSLVSAACYVLAAAASLLLGEPLRPILMLALGSSAGSYLGALSVAVYITITKWRMIHAGALKKIIYIFTFPIFMLTYVPISVSALFGAAEWRPIEHRAACSLREVVRG